MNLADLRAELDHLQVEHPKGIHGTPDEVLVYACRLYEIMVERTATAPRKCQTCRWWQVGPKPTQQQFGRCTRWLSQWSMARPSPLDSVAEPRAINAGPHGEDVVANGLVTGPLFACIHWEG